MTEQDSKQIAETFVKHQRDNGACPIHEVAYFFSRLSIEIAQEDKERASLIMNCYVTALTDAVCQQESGVDAIAAETFRMGIDNLEQHANIVIHLGNIVDLHHGSETIQ